MDDSTLNNCFIVINNYFIYLFIYTNLFRFRNLNYKISQISQFIQRYNCLKPETNKITYLADCSKYTDIDTKQKPQNLLIGRYLVEGRRDTLWLYFVFLLHMNIPGFLFFFFHFFFFPGCLANLRVFGKHSASSFLNYLLVQTRFLFLLGGGRIFKNQVIASSYDGHRSKKKGMNFSLKKKPLSAGVLKRWLRPQEIVNNLLSPPKKVRVQIVSDSIW